MGGWLRLSSFCVVWLCRYMFVFFHSLHFPHSPLAPRPDKSTLIDLLLQPVCKLQPPPPPFFSSSHLGRSSSASGEAEKVTNFPFSPSNSFCFQYYFLLFHSSSSSLLRSQHHLHRWRLTGECSTIRPHDCLLLRRWMEAPSASPTQPQLHQPP